ncbi:tyrosine-type recombinase/integrase [Natrarchaeobaculum aegyptiacum]|uniref:Integrase n=1 Tax=Natrarchaeobaculum aegyptiacum TaxID=745377 RepID=A0A2Z2I0U4_9EURY|nr:site-specific integrase [Natrarchaeobaculum aegyptiacum]ARS91254.1 integrase [Natrarchaeobaculum aegyptiacum]
MHTDLKPIEPRKALELYLDDRRGDLADWTLRSHRSRLSTFIDWCEEERIGNLNELTGRDIHRYKVWRRNDGDLSKVTVKTQIDTVRVFAKWLASIEGCDPELPAKIKSPSLAKGENARSVELHSDEATKILTYLEKYHYCTLPHVTLSLLWHGLMRRGAVRAIDLRDYYPDEQYLDLKHRPESDTPLKNGTGGERPIAVSESVCELLDDWVADKRPNSTDEYGRKPLLATSQGRIHLTTIQQYVYMWSRPCKYGADCPHDRDPDDCSSANERYSASECPSSISPHAVRRGSITHWLREEIPQPVVSDRADVSADVLDAHYDERTSLEKMEQRRKFLDNI